MALPAVLRTICPAEVTGTVVVEAVYSLDDNHWMLRLSDTDPFILGLVGKLDPGARASRRCPPAVLSQHPWSVGSPRFTADLAGLAAHRRFVGIRCGSAELLAAERAGVGVLRQLAALDLQLDFAGGWEDIRALLELLPAVPGLRVVINHMGNPRFTAGAAPDPDWLETMQVAARHERVYMKVSALFATCPPVAEGPPAAGGSDGSPTVLPPYAPHLDALWQAFGEDRLVYGSDWPVCNNHGPDTSAVYTQQVAVLTEWIWMKGQAAADKLFWGNAAAAYKFPPA